MEAVLASGARFTLTAKGESMLPTIRSGDRLTVASKPLDRIRVGDVLAVGSRDGHLLAVHRLIARHPRGYVLAGDFSYNLDGVVYLDQVIGELVRCERGGREVKLGITCGKRSMALGARWATRHRLFRYAWRGMLRLWLWRDHE